MCGCVWEFYAGFSEHSPKYGWLIIIFPILNAGEGPLTLQSSVIPEWNYAPQLLGKVTPTFSPIVNAARK